MKISLILFVISHVMLVVRCTPSVDIVKDADPYADARTMRKALHGPGTDEKAIRHLLPYRSCNHRHAISQAYWELYRDDITRRIARDTSGTYEQILKDCFLCGEFLMASFFERAITGGTDRHRKNKSVIEIIVTHTDSAQKRDALLTAYQQMYGRSIEHDIKKHLGGDFENVLLEMIWRERAASRGCDNNNARDMAVELNNEVGKWGNHRDVLNTVLINTAFDQANAILDEFKKLTGFDLITVVSNKMDHEKANAYEDLIHYVVTYNNGDHLHYYATRLKEATDGPGTDEQTINRIVLSHAEVDMKEIEDTYYAAFHKRVRSKIAHDTSGAYENFLKQFLSKSADEARVGLELAQMIVDQGNQETKMLAEQGLLGPQYNSMVLNSQNPSIMNRFSNMQAPQAPQIIQPTTMNQFSNMQVPQVPQVPQIAQHNNLIQAY